MQVNIPVRFYSYRIDNESFQTFLYFARRIRFCKELLSMYLYAYPEKIFHYDSWYDFRNEINFINNSIYLDKELLTNLSQPIKKKRKENKQIHHIIGVEPFSRATHNVYTNYKNYVNLFRPKLHGKYKRSIMYLGKSIKFDKNKLQLEKYEWLKDEIKQAKLEGKDIFLLAERYKHFWFNRYLKHHKLINYKSLSFKNTNTLCAGKTMINTMKQKASKKQANAYLQIRIPSEDELQIPFRYNKDYHYGIFSHLLKDGHENTEYTAGIDLLKKRIYFILWRKEEREQFTNKIENEILGVDVNTKHNLFACSTGIFIHYNKDFIDKCIQFLNYKSSHSFSKSKATQLYQQKINRRVENHVILKVKELIAYARQNNFHTIVLEDNGMFKMYGISKIGELTIKTERLQRFLHFSGIKHVVIRLANKEGINVHLVNPAYTSRTCPACGFISDKNRKTQESFKCIECGYTENADINAAINIKNRISITKLRKSLEVYSAVDKMFIPNKLKGKQIVAVYENLFK